MSKNSYNIIPDKDLLDTYSPDWFDKKDVILGSILDPTQWGKDENQLLKDQSEQRYKKAQTLTLMRKLVI